MLKQDEGFAKGVNIAKHYCTNKAVADSLNLEYKSVENVLFKLFPLVLIRLLRLGLFFINKLC